jgi:hypothetical protein
MFFGWDCLREYWQDVVYPLVALGRGELPLWNPYVLGGAPFLGDPQTGLFAPVNWLCWLLALVSGSQGAWLIQVKVLTNLWIGLMGMHVLVTRRAGSHLAGTAAALIYVLGSPLLVHKNGAFLWPFLYLPWAALTLEHLVEDPSLRTGLLAAAGIWLCGSAGHPQGFFYCLLILAAYWLFLTLSAPQGRVASLRRQAPWAAVSLLVITALLLPIYWPAAEAVAESPRASRGLAYVLQQPLTPGDLGELLLPNLDRNWMKDIYLGPLALVLALFGVFAARAWRQRARRIFWLALATFGLLLAMGEHTPVLPFLAEHVPGFGLFRIAYRHKLIVAFCVAMAAGEGVGVLVRSEAPRWARWGLTALATAWIGLGLLAVRGALPSLAPPSSKDAVLHALLAAGLALALVVAAAWFGRRARLLLLPAVALILADLWIAGGSKIRILQPPPTLAAAAAAVAPMRGVGASWRFHKADYPPDTNTSAILAAREFSGYWSLPTRLRRHQEVLERARHDPEILRHFNVRWILSRRPVALREPGSRRLAPALYELGGVTPLLRVYHRAERVSSGELLTHLTRPGLRGAALVARGEPAPALPSSKNPPVTGQLIRHGINQIVARVHTRAPGIAVLNESFYPGWAVEVNGTPARIFRANHLMRATLVPAGESVIRFHYSPTRYYPALIAFLAALAAVIAALFWPRRRQAVRSPLAVDDDHAGDDHRHADPAVEVDLLAEDKLGVGEAEDIDQ